MRPDDLHPGFWQLVYFNHRLDRALPTALLKIVHSYTPVYYFFDKLSFVEDYDPRLVTQEAILLRTLPTHETFVGGIGRIVPNVHGNIQFYYGEDNCATAMSFLALRIEPLSAEERRVMSLACIYSIVYGEHRNLYFQSFKDYALLVIALTVKFNTWRARMVIANLDFTPAQKRKLLAIQLAFIQTFPHPMFDGELSHYDERLKQFVQRGAPMTEQTITLKRKAPCS